MKYFIIGALIFSIYLNSAKDKEIQSLMGQLSACELNLSE